MLGVSLPDYGVGGSYVLSPPVSDSPFGLDRDLPRNVRVTDQEGRTDLDGEVSWRPERVLPYRLPTRRGTPIRTPYHREDDQETHTRPQPRDVLSRYATTKYMLGSDTYSRRTTPLDYPHLVRGDEDRPVDVWCPTVGWGQEGKGCTHTCTTDFDGRVCSRRKSSCSDVPGWRKGVENGKM